MSTWAYVQIEIIPIIALALLLYTSRNSMASSSGLRRFKWLIWMVISILVIDGLSWYTLANPQRYSVGVIWIVNILYFLLTEWISYGWFLYAYYQINDNRLTKEQQHRIMLGTIPLVVICAIIILSPWCRLVFYIEPITHSYHRGPGHIVQVLVGFAYILCASVLAYRKSKGERIRERKNEYLFLCFIAILPFVGGMLQTLNYDFIFLWSFTAASVILIYIDFQHHQISMDNLTALHNRGHLEQHLNERLTDTSADWYFVMIDIDKFKAINDKYGHVQGDRALRIVAEALKDAFGGTDAFVARYGGDEFSVVIDVASDQELDSILVQCQEQLNKNVRSQRLPYEIRLSMGYQRYRAQSTDTIEQVIRMADEHMYQNKRAHKNENPF